MRLRLARQLGCSVRELPDRMDSDEYSLWLAHYATTPEDVDRLVFQVALLTACMVNSLGAKPPADPDDFIPNRKRELKEENWRAMKAKLAILTKARQKAHG